MSIAGLPRVGFIGAGRLGSSLAAALTSAGYDVATVAGRDAESSTSLASLLGPNVQPTTQPELVLETCELIFLTVQDREIEPLAQRLPWRASHLVVHCSGARGLGVLQRASAVGAVVGCLHPLQSFPSRTPDPGRFTNIFCGVEGEEPISGVLERLVATLGARTIRLEGVDRALYHAAAVFTSNYVIALASAARRVWTMAGLPPESAREALAPLILSVAESIGEMELEDALTGPIARGDVRTIAAHLSALSPDPALQELYQCLGTELLDLAVPADPTMHSLLTTTPPPQASSQ
ncbi:MAG: Rossmann-like and DUF2520 domain-containing protein [Tepidiformaceae bacterium]